MEETKVKGLTKNSGFQIGVRRTFSVPAEKAWKFMFSKEGIQLWLGQLDSYNLGVNTEYRSTTGEGMVKVFKPHSHIRLTWKKKNWDNISTLQIRIIDSKGRATISFHQDKLESAKQREEMKAYWEGQLNKIEEKINK